MYIFVIAIHVIACCILIAAILLQSGRGGGLSEVFSGAASQTIFGTRASTFLTRTTTAAAVTFLLTCITLTVFSARRGKSLLEGKGPIAPITEEGKTEPVSPKVVEETQEESTGESEEQTPVAQE